MVWPFFVKEIGQCHFQNVVLVQKSERREIC